MLIHHYFEYMMRMIVFIKDNLLVKRKCLLKEKDKYYLR